MYHDLRATGVIRSLYLFSIYVGSILYEPIRDIYAWFLSIPFRKKILWVGILLIGVEIVTIILRVWTVQLIILLLVVLVGTRIVYLNFVKPSLQFRYWRTHSELLVEDKQGVYCSKSAELDLEKDQYEKLEIDLEDGELVVIADFDQDGSILSRYGPIPRTYSVEPANFIPRKRNELQLVALGNLVGVKKKFKQWKSFLNELLILHTLRGRCNVPAIIFVDFDELFIVFSYIQGIVIRRELASQGAKVLHQDLDSDEQHKNLTGLQRRRKRIHEAKKVLDQVVDDEITTAIFSELQRIHKSGVVIRDIKYGNIILENEYGDPYFIDFDFSQRSRYPGGIRAELKRDQDIERFNYIFNTRNATRAQIKMIMKALQAQNGMNMRRSVNFGRGLSFGKRWKIDHGEGLWDYLVKPNLPDINGMRVLDLCWQEPIFSIHISLAGAEEIVRIEPEGNLNGYGEFLKRGFEWSNSCSMNIISLNMNLDQFVEHSIGDFDLAILGEEIFSRPEMFLTKLMRKLKSISTQVMILHNKSFDIKGANKSNLRFNKNSKPLFLSEIFIARQDVVPPWGEQMLTILN